MTFAMQAVIQPWATFMLIVSSFSPLGIVMDFDVWSVFTILSVLPVSVAFSLVIGLTLKPTP